MRTRLPLTIWRFILVDLLRLVLVTTVVLVAVISFAAAIKPLADGKLAPLDTLRFMVLAIPPMLQYALPFAAGFGATLAYHRMSQDNEFVAAHASGVSHRQLLMPAAVTGLAIGLVLLLLMEQIIPRFLRSMEELITEDATRLIVGTIERREPIREGNMMIYADAAKRLGPQESTGAYERILLSRVAVVQLHDDGTVRGEVTAERAWVWLFHSGVGSADTPTDGYTTVVIKLENAIGNWDGKNYAKGDVLIPDPILIPGLLDDDPKFLTFGELREAKKDPDVFNSIGRWRRNLAHHFGERLAVERIREDLAAEGSVKLMRGDQTIVIRSGGVGRYVGDVDWDGRVPDGRWELLPLKSTGLIEIDMFRTQNGELGLGSPTRLTAESAGFATYMGGNDLSARQLTLNLQVDRPTVRASSSETAIIEGPAASQLVRREFTNLRLADNPLPALLAKSSAELLKMVEPRINRSEPDRFLTGPSNDLSRRLMDIKREITSKQQERLAMAAACLVMVLTGAVAAMRLGQSLPLTVYLWSFFPALGAILTISAGQQMTHQMGMPGLGMLWGGVVAFGLYAAATFSILKRH